MKYFRIRYALAVPGVLLTLFGFWLISHPIAYILGGLCLIAVSTVQSKPKQDVKSEKGK